MSAARVCHFKLVLLGDTAVGKSCLVVRFVRDEFFEFQEPTIGAAFLTQSVATGAATVKFEIWDTAGQERYRSLAPMYYRDSFNGAKSWVKELQRRGDPNAVIALAGNKADLQSKRKIDYQEAQQYAEENGIMHIETSAKNDTNVKSLFHEIGTYGLSIKAHISGGVAQKLPSQAPQSDREAFPLIPCVPTRVDVFLA